MKYSFWGKKKVNIVIKTSHSKCTIFSIMILLSNFHCLPSEVLFFFLSQLYYTWLKCSASVCASCFKKYEYIYNFWHCCRALFYKLSLQLVAFFYNELLINYSRYCLSPFKHCSLQWLSQPLLELCLGLNPWMPHSHQLSPLYSCHHLPQKSFVLFPAHFSMPYCIRNMFQHDITSTY